MSGEPAWNILLDLFISGAANRTLSVSAVCIGARSPAATALRYLSLLQEAGLVERSPDTSDARRSHVRLTSKGWSKMLGFLR
jgi:DNA-binding IclR family transcriptional regulator